VHNSERIACRTGAVRTQRGALQQLYATLMERATAARDEQRGQTVARRVRDPPRPLVLDVVDNQVRALRRRDLIDRFIAGNKVGDEGALVAQNARGRMGAYWGIDSDVNKINPAFALPCDPTITRRLGLVATRLSDLGGETSKQLVNWGYAVCDRSIRSNYKGPLDDVMPDRPYPEARLG
jgi:hypothetical protein